MTLLFDGGEFRILVCSLQQRCRCELALATFSHLLYLLFHNYSYQSTLVFFCFLPGIRNLAGGNSDHDDSDDEPDKKGRSALDTDVGFEWGGLGAKQANKKDDDDSSEDSDSEDEDDDDDDDDEGKSSSHKSRKKQAQRCREEQEISRQEMALADGTADENPETAGDFE